MVSLEAGTFLFHTSHKNGELSFLLLGDQLTVVLGREWVNLVSLVRRFRANSFFTVHFLLVENLFLQKTTVHIYLIKNGA